MKKLLFVLLLFALPARAVTFTPSTPTRTVNSNFQPSTTHWVVVNYTVTINSDDGETGTVELRSDASNPPTTVRTSGFNDFAVSGIVGVTGHSHVNSNLIYIVPPGDFVRINTSGSASFTLQHQTEQTVAAEFDGVDFATRFSYK